MSTQEITTDAELATRLILSDSDYEPDSFIERKVRQAYLLGRTHQAAVNFDATLAYVRGGKKADSNEQQSTN